MSTFFTSTNNSSFNVSLIWFGTAVSVAEIMTGTFLAPLGMKDGFLAILVGHVIGGIILYLAGIINVAVLLKALIYLLVSWVLSVSLY